MLKSGAKRFYNSVGVREQAKAFAVLLDDRSIKTPAGHTLLAPTRALAEALAAEWRAQGETIVPDAMPLTKLINTALDRIPLHRDAIVDDLAKYADADLLCYRAASPVALVRRQTAAWDPWLNWAAERFGAHLAVTTGVAHIAQPQDALARLRQAVAALDGHHLIALHAAVTITGSAVLGLAFTARAVDADAAFAAAQIDDTYQAELWGRDAEAESIRARRLEELRAAERYLDLLAPADAT